MLNPDIDSIAELQAQIAELEQALGRLADLPTAREQLATQLADARQRLVLLQTGGVNLGVGNSIGVTGDIVAGAKIQIERVAQTVYQIVLAQREPNDLHAMLERLLAEAGPGYEFDLYQAVVAGLIHANVRLTIDTRGAPPLVGDAGLQLPPFATLLEQLRAVILRPGGLPVDELAVRAAHYRALIVQQFRDLRLEGLSSSTRPIVLPLAQVYVELHAVAEVPELADAFTPEERRLLKLLNQRGEDPLIESVKLREARLCLDALRHERWTRNKPQHLPIAQVLSDPKKCGLVMLGDPGSGKSTLLQFFALSFAEGPAVVTQRFQFKGADAVRLPIFAPLAAYDDMLNQTPELTVQVFLARYYDQRRTIPGLGPVFDRAIGQGQALILLDGLDEVVEETRRQFVAQQVSHFVQEALRQGNRVIVTSRIYGYRLAPLTVDVPHITVLDFGKEEIVAFARQWFRAFQRWKSGTEPSAPAKLLAQQEEQRLLEEIGRNPGVERLAVNPLLLTMLVLLRQQLGTLPERRITLYDEYVCALVQRWEEYRSRGARFHRLPMTRVDLTEAEGALIELALWLQQNRPSGTASECDLLELLTLFFLWDGQGLRPATDRILPPQRRQAEEHARDFLRDMRQYSGLLIERGQGVFGFRHLTFQEYFAGRALAGRHADERWYVLKDHLHSGRWREPLLLCAARLGVTENRANEANVLVMQVLEAHSEYEEQLHRDLFLAADCAADDIGLALPLLQRIADRLVALLDAPVPVVAHEALQRLHGLALLRVGGRAQLPDVQQQVIDALLCQSEHGWGARSSNLLARLPVRVDRTLQTLLIQYLSDQAWVRRSRAIQALAPCLADNPDVRAAILGCATDLSEYVRRGVVLACSPLVAQDADLRLYLQHALVDPDAQVREAAIKGLQPLLATYPELKAAVYECLYDDTDDVRYAAVVALAPLLDQADDLLEKLIRALASLLNTSHHETPFADRIGLPDRGVALIAPLLAALEHKNDAIRLVAVDLLGPFVQSHPQVRDALIARLADPDWEVCELVIDTLVEEADHDPQVVTALYRLIERVDLDETVLNHLLWSMRSFLEHDAQLRARLLTLLGRSSAGVRNGVLQALAPLAAFHPEVCAAQCAHLSDPDPQIRSTALRALTPLLATQPEIRRALAACAAEPEPRVREELLCALAPHAAGDTQIALVMAQAFRLRDAVFRRKLIDLLAPLVQSDSVDAQLIADQLANQHCAEAAIGRAAVVLALGLLADEPEIHDMLLDRLADEDAQVRRAAVQRLGEQCSQHADVRQALQQCLADADTAVAVAAVVALTPSAANQADVRAALLEALGRAPRPLQDALLSALGPLCATAVEVRDALVALLVSAATSDDRLGVSELLKVLTPLVPQATSVRDAVLTYLRQATLINWDNLVALGPLLPHDPALHAAVLHCLAHLPSYTLNVGRLQPLMAADAEVRAIVVGWLKHQNRHWREAVLIALGALLPTCAELREPVMAMLGDPEPLVRAAAVNALAPLLTSDPAVAQALMAAQDDSFVVVWEAVCAALAPLAASHAEVRALLMQGLDYKPVEMAIAAIRALEPLARRDSAVQAALFQRLADPTSAVRHRLLDALAPLAVDQPDLRAALMLLLTDRDEHIRIKALTVLAPLAGADPALRHALTKRLTDPSERVRSKALTLLTPLAEADPALRIALLDCCNDASAFVRRSLVRQVVRLAGTAAAALLLKIADSDNEMRVAALEELIACEWSDPTVLTTLLSMIEPPKQSRQEVRHQQRLADAPLAHLIERLAQIVRSDARLRMTVITMLGSPDWRQRGGAAHVLAAAGPASVRVALPQLLAALDDWRGHESWQARLAAATVLVNHDRFGEQAVAVLRQALGSDAQIGWPNRVRNQAAQGLGRLRALYHRRDVATQIADLLASGQNTAALDGLYQALAALAAAPELE